MLLCDSYITFLIEAKVVNLPEVTSDKTLNVQPCVGADLCVRPFSSERNVSCGRTRRSAPTANYTFRCTTCFVNNGRPWCHSVTCPVGTHDLCVRPRQRLFRQILRRRDCNDNGRTDRASLHWVTRVIAIRLALSTTDALRLDTSRASLHWVTRLVLSVSFFVSLGLRNINLIELDRYGDTFFRGVPH